MFKTPYKHSEDDWCRLGIAVLRVVSVFAAAVTFVLACAGIILLLGGCGW